MDPTTYNSLIIEPDWEPDLVLQAPSDGTLAQLVRAVNEDRKLSLGHCANEVEVHQQLPTALRGLNMFTLPQVCSLKHIGKKIEAARLNSSGVCGVNIVNTVDPTTDSIARGAPSGTHWVTVFVTKAPGIPSQTCVTIVDTWDDPPGGTCRRLLRWCRKLGAHTAFCGMHSADKQLGLTCGYQSAAVLGHVFSQPGDFKEGILVATNRVIELVGQAATTATCTTVTAA